jgi:hypothetical protein
MTLSQPAQLSYNAEMLDWFGGRIKRRFLGWHNPHINNTFSTVETLKK